MDELIFTFKTRCRGTGGGIITTSAYLPHKKKVGINYSMYSKQYYIVRCNHGIFSEKIKDKLVRNYRMAHPESFCWKCSKLVKERGKEKYTDIKISYDFDGKMKTEYEIVDEGIIEGVEYTIKEAEEFAVNKIRNGFHKPLTIIRVQRKVIKTISRKGSNE